MRWYSQLAVIVVLAGAGAGGWYFWGQNAVGNQGPATGRGGGGPVAVEFITARQGSVVEKIESVGTARANEAVLITAKQPGTIATLNFNEGQRVRAGQILAELDTKERKADLDQAKAGNDEARQRLDRARQLRGTGSVTEARLDELDSQFRATEARLRMAQARLDDVRITAPFDGRVGMRQVSLGAMLQSGGAVTTLDDISKIKLEFSVPEVMMGNLRPGLAVVARTPAFSDRDFTGQVTVVDTRVDPTTRSIRVNALIDNPDEALKPGLFLNVDLVVSRRDNALIVPEEAIVPEATKHYVFIVRDNRVNRREVTLGMRFPGEVEIVKGITLADQIVARGTQKIRDNQPVRPSPLKPTS